MVDPQVALVERALASHPIALRALLEVIEPAIQISAAETLRHRMPAASYGRARHEIEDLAQEVLLALFANDGKRLRAWDPAKGLGLPGYVKLVARHLVLSFLRKRERRVWEDEEVDEAVPGSEQSSDSPEGLTAQKELQLAVLAAVEADLTVGGREIFRRLVVEGQTVSEICEATGMTPNAVHVWRSRLSQRAADARRLLLRGEHADD
jgi:RNA polymerase sigma factor (sigma-70 family)